MHTRSCLFRYAADFLEQLRVPLMHHYREISTVVQDHIGSPTIRTMDSLLNAPVILLFRFTFPSETGVPAEATAAAAWSCVLKMLQEDQRTSAPSCCRVSMRT